MNLSGNDKNKITGGNDKNKITGKKYQPVMSATGLKDQGLNLQVFT